MSKLTIPETLSFEQAIDLSQSLITAMAQGELTEAEIVDLLTELVKSENGARGFFVTYLSDDQPLADQPSDAVVQALRTSPEIVAELMAKNLAMSTAMAISHRRNDREDMAQGSDRVRSRSIHLIQLLQLPTLSQKLQQLHESIATGIGTYQTFLDRWNYDAEQRQAIRTVIESVMQA